jgi:HEAT repeat protein
MKFIPQKINLLKNIAIFIGIGFISGAIFFMSYHWWRNVNYSENFETGKLAQQKIEPDSEPHYNFIRGFSSRQLQAYWDDGNINDTMKLANDSIIEFKQKISHTIDRLITFRSVRSFWKLKRLFKQAKQENFLVPQFRAALYVIYIPPQLLFPELESDDADIRHIAAIKLGELGYHEATEPLIESLKSSDWEIRQRAVSALAYLDVKKAAKPLIELLQDQNEPVRLSAINALVKLNVPEMVNPLIQLLNNSSGKIRQRVVAVLVQLGAKKAIESLINLVTAQNEDSLIAMKALLKLRATEAINPLFELWKNIDWNDHYDVIEALEQLGAKEKVIKQLLELLKNKNKDLRERAISGLGLLQAKEAIKPLIELLDDPDNEVVRSTVSALGNLRAKEAIKPLIELLDDPDNEVVRSTASALGYLGAKEAIKPIIGLLKEQDKYFRRSAAYALWRLGAKEAIQPLIEMPLDRELRRDVRKVLLRLAWKTGSQPFLQLLNSPNQFVRYRVINILAELGTNEIIQPLIGLLDDQDKTVRYLAARTLGQLGASEAVNPLIKLLGDQESSVRDDAIKALGQLGASEAIKPLIKLLNELNEPNYHVRYKVIYALAQLGAKEAIIPLMELLKQDYSDYRIRAAKMLVQLGAIEAIKPLIELLSVRDVKRKAAYALGQLGAYEATELLIELLDENSSAMKALIQLEAVEAIKPFIESQRRTGQTIYPFINLLEGNLSSRNFARLALSKSRVEKMHGVLIEELKELKNQDWIIRQNRLNSLSRLGVHEAIQPLMELLKDKNIFVRRDAISGLSELGIMTEAFSKEIAALKKGSNSQSIKQRQRVAGKLGQFFSLQSVNLLIFLLKDNNLRVKKQAIISLGNLGERQPQLVQPALSHLYPLLANSNIHIRRAVLETFVKIVPQLSEEQNTLAKKLTHIVDNFQEILAVRIAALQILGKIGTEAVVDTIIKNLRREIGIQRSHSFILIAFRALGNIAHPKALGFLQSQLKRLEKRKLLWRHNYANKVFNKNSWDYSQWETELGYAIAQIDPEQAGIKLLAHKLAEVRKGAWLAIGKIGDIAIVKDLIQQRRVSKRNQTHFRHATYRAIDKSLITIEVHGDEQDLKVLKELKPEVKHIGIQDRLQWTIYQLEDKLEKIILK